MTRKVEASIHEVGDGYSWKAIKRHGDRKPVISECGVFSRKKDCVDNCEREYINYKVEWYE